MSPEETRRVLEYLLTDSGAVWKYENGWHRFRMERDGCIWEAACRCEADAVLIYGRWPFRLPDRGQGLVRCNAVNGEIARGAVFLPEDGFPVYRVRAELDDPFGAGERLKTALAYSAAVVLRFWGRLSACMPDR